MPPKAKYSREEIISAALAIIERDGEEALTARSLGEELKSSARPIFTVFTNMDEVLTAVAASARGIYTSMVEEGLKEELPFKGVGKAYIRFAATRPKLFQMLFMKEQCAYSDKDSVLNGIETNYGKILRSIVECYGFDEETAKEFYFHLWVYSHGIAVLLATNVCKLTPEQVSGMLTEVAASLLMKIKSEKKI